MWYFGNVWFLFNFFFFNILRSTWTPRYMASLLWFSNEWKLLTWQQHCPGGAWTKAKLRLLPPGRAGLTQHPAVPLLVSIWTTISGAEETFPLSFPDTLCKLFCFLHFLLSLGALINQNWKGSRFNISF